MFWDGEHWVDEALLGARTSPRRRRHPRLKAVLVATLMTALLVPVLSVSAAAPTLAVSGSVSPGSSVTVTANGFGTRDWVQLQWDGSVAGMPMVRTSGQGTFGTAITIPPSTSVGLHVLSAIARSPAGGRNTWSTSSTGVLASTTVPVFNVVADAPPTSQPTPTPAPTPQPTAPPTSQPTPTPAPTPQPTATPTASPVACGTSLQGRIDAVAAGSTLDLTGCFYAGNANVTKPLTIMGGTLSYPSGSVGIRIAASNVVIDGMTITGAQYATYVEDYAVRVDGTTAAPLSGIKIRNSRISRAGKAGIWATHVNSFDISYNTIQDAVYTGISVFSAIGGSISHNLVNRVGYTVAESNLPGPGNAYGINVNDQGLPASSDVVVSYNTVTDVPTWHGIDTHGGQRISFIGNTIQRSRRGLFITISSASGSQASSIVVQANQILSPYPLTDPTTAVTLYEVSGASFTGNTISGWGPNSPTAALPWFDYLGLSTGLSATGNTVTP